MSLHLERYLVGQVGTVQAELEGREMARAEKHADEVCVPINRALKGVLKPTASEVVSAREVLQQVQSCIM